MRPILSALIVKTAEHTLCSSAPSAPPALSTYSRIEIVSPGTDIQPIMGHFLRQPVLRGPTSEKLKISSYKILCVIYGPVLQSLADA
jgi:hypothetical protein